VTDIYGGLFFENLVRQDEYLAHQLALLKRGLIQGIQIRVAHPEFTPEITERSLPHVFSALPQGCKLFIHLGAENVGVDLGQNLDETGVFAQKANGRTWDEWNLESLDWGLTVAKTVNSDCVLHPGYGKGQSDGKARKLVAETLRCLDDGHPVFLENVPPIAGTYWGFGGTPEDMASLLKDLGPAWECLIDFTHMYVMKNQLHLHYGLKGAVNRYLDLPHCPVCHFSGTPDTLVDCHTSLDEPAVPILIDAFSGMEAICLEIPWNPENLGANIKSIEGFRRKYKIS
jgi:hypothetical protein